VKDSELDDLVRALPRETASPGFAARVQRRVREPQPARGGGLRLAAGAAALVLVITAAGFQSWQRAKDSPARLARDARAVRADLEQLAATLEQRDAGSRLIYVGGDDHVDLVIDSRRLAEQPPPPHTDIRPVSYGGHEL
jgi:hypothetical protein